MPQQGLREVSVTAESRDAMRLALGSRSIGHSRGRYVFVTGLADNTTTHDVTEPFLEYDLLEIAASLFRVRLCSTLRNE